VDETSACFISVDGLVLLMLLEPVQAPVAEHARVQEY